MKERWQLTLLLAITGIAALVHWKLHPVSVGAAQEICDPTRITELEICLPEVLKKWDAKSFVWIDARSESEWKHDGVPGSLHLATSGSKTFDEQLEEILTSLGERHKAIVYCSDSGCGLSKEVAKRLRDVGLFDEVKALHGGWKALRAAGMTRTEPTN
jgi:rhodanese-related sulfurtransferase